MIVVPEHIKLILFDCDGTLAETLDIHWNAWLQTLAAYNAPEVPLTFLERFNGMPTAFIVEQVNREFSLALPVLEVARTKDGAITALLDRVKPVETVIALARAESRRRIVTVLSGGDRVNVERTLEVIGCGDLFQAVYCGDDENPPKADPELYRWLASLYALTPNECMLIEDADMPMEAATVAGCHTFDIRRAENRELISQCYIHC